MFLGDLMPLPARAQVAGQEGATHGAASYAPIYHSSRSMGDFLSRALSAGRLEAGDSVMLQALAVLGKVQLPSSPIKPIPTKCGTGVLTHAHEIAQLSKNTWGHAIQAIPGSDTSLLSRSGKFRIFYYTSGDSAATRQYAEAVANYADEAFIKEVGEMGYAQPPFTAAEPQGSMFDSTYHIYIINLGRRTNPPYGYTERMPGGQLPATPAGLPRSRTFLVIDNDYIEEIYTTHGLDGALITVFHEFHHMIQFGSYGESSAYSYFQEMTATWMEMQASSEIDDYLQYVPFYVEFLTDRFDRSMGGGYGQSIWLEYLADVHSVDFVRTVWEYYRDVHSDPVTAFDQKLRAAGSNFQCTYAEFGEELFFTGWRTRITSPFSDASKLPVGRVEVEYLEPNEEASDSPFPVSLTLYSSGFGRDTVVLSIARDTARVVSARIESAKITSASNYDVVYSDSSRFCEAFGASDRIVADVFPQPFMLRGITGDEVKILVSNTRMPVTSRVAIHTTSMTEITTIDNQVETIAGGYYVTWNGRDAVGRIIPSGIYLYSVDADGVTRTGKIAVVRDGKIRLEE